MRSKITCEMLEMEGAIFERSLEILLNKCLQESRILDAWQDGEVILLFKKGGNNDIEHYIIDPIVFSFICTNFLPRLLRIE